MAIPGRLSSDGFTAELTMGMPYADYIVNDRKLSDFNKHAMDAGEHIAERLAMGD